MPKQREHWGSQIGFILAAAGSAIGLGTLWKFPYVTGENGGGLFVFIYVFCIFFVGVPLFIAELMLGRRAQRGAVGVFASLSNDSTVWKAAGWLGVSASFLIMSYYSVLAGWGLNYILMSLNQFWVGRSPGEVTQIFEVLESSGDITLFWQAAFIALTVGLVLPGIRHGIEYWSRFMTIGLLVLLVGLCFYSITLDGFPQAAQFIFYPDASELKPSGFLEALGLSFFTLSLGQGVMLTYGSYLRREDDIPKTGLIVGSMILLVACLASMTIFPILFTFDQPPQSGPGLVFKALPLLFAKLPGALIISTTFFTLFVLTALTSAMPLIEVVAANFMDLFGWSRKKAVLIVGIAAFVFGIPSALSGSTYLFSNWDELYGKTFFATVDGLVSNWIIPIGGFMTVIFTGWFLDTSMLRQEFETGSAFKWLWGPWVFFIRWVAPIAIIAILLQMGGLVNFDVLVQ
ncbi:MAG: hypothetical protein K940chlam3_00629 [Chlamydiae bacterium]|nr:hypothetical protein [Chlamydiota bacterium]